MPASNGDFYVVDVQAEFLVSERTVFRWMEQGILSGKRKALGRGMPWRFTPAAMVRLRRSLSKVVRSTD